jgi:branched-chain amino acid aminotransferase
MKAYRGDDGKIRLFRPDLNMKRMLTSAERSVLPVGAYFQKNLFP